MLNEVIVMGKILSKPVLNETMNGNKVANIILEVKRPFRNNVGVYESDFIHCILWRGVAETCCNLCNVGDMLCIKGRLQSRFYESPDKQNVQMLEVVAEKVELMNKYF